MVNPIDEGLEEISRHVDAAVTSAHRRRSERATALALDCLHTNAEKVDGLKRSQEGVEGELSELLTKLPQAVEAAKVEADRLAEDEAGLEGDLEAIRERIWARAAEPLRQMKAEHAFLRGEKNVIDGDLMVQAEEQARLEAVPGVLEALKARRDEAEREAAREAAAEKQAAEQKAAEQKAVFQIKFQTFREVGLGGLGNNSFTPPAQPTLSLADLLVPLGPPQPLDDEGGARAELKRLNTATEKLVSTPRRKEDQKDVLELLIVRLRCVKGVLGDVETIALLSRKLYDFSHDQQPGYLECMTRDAVPSGGTWFQDAKKCWEALQPAPAPPRTPTKKQTSPPQAKVAVGPPTVRAAVDAAHLAFPETLVFTKSALDSADASSYPHTQKVESAFGALDTVCKNRRAANGGGIGPLEDAFAALACEYSAHQSEDTLNRWGRDYEVTYEGRSFSIQENLKLGNDRGCLRIYFGWDNTEQRFVVAHCGEHKRTGQT